MSVVLEVLFFGILFPVCCVLIGVCVEVGLDNGFEYAGQHHAAEPVIIPAAVIGARGAGDDPEPIFRI